MAAKCEECGSADTQPLADVYQCLDCGHTTDYPGRS